MSIQDKPCAECEDCIPIGDGEGLCDYYDDVSKKFLVDLFNIASYCPKPTEVEKKEGGVNGKEK